MILRSEDPQHARLAVLVLEIHRHRLRRAVTRALDAEHDEGTALQLAPELFFDLTVVGHFSSPLSLRGERTQDTRRSRYGLSAVRADLKERWEDTPRWR